MSPTVKPKENRADYVKRCIPQVLEEGSAKNPKHAAGMCHGMFTASQKAEEDGVLLTHHDLIKIAKKEQAEKRGYFGGNAGEDFPDPHLNDDGTFVGGYAGCVEHMIACEGYEKVEACNICEYLGSSQEDMTTGPEEPEFGNYGGIAEDRPYFQDNKNTGLPEPDMMTDFMSSKTKEEKRGIESQSDVSVISGHYPELEKGALPKKSAEFDDLSDVEVPENLKPRKYFAEPAGTQKDKATKKKLWGMDEIEVPEELKPREYGKMKDEVPKLKQP